MTPLKFLKKAFCGTTAYGKDEIAQVEDQHARRLMEAGAAVAVSRFEIPTQADTETASDPLNGTRKAVKK